MITGMRELFLETYKNQTGEGLALSQENVFELSEKLDKVADWLKEKTDGQAALAAHEDPALKVMDIQVISVCQIDWWLEFFLWPTYFDGQSLTWEFRKQRKMFFFQKTLLSIYLIEYF